MKSVLDFLGVDIDALKREKRKILIYDVGIREQHMLLRLATRKVEVGGFYVKDFAGDEPFYLCNKRVYSEDEIKSEKSACLLLKCENDHPTRGGGISFKYRNQTFS